MPPDTPKTGSFSFYPRLVMFTPLHRSLGLAPIGPTDEILDQAAEAGVTESYDFDWKSELPAQSGLGRVGYR
ncbi:hypothetical protein ORI20_24500 [Mycobacterium sp. CVI_P3]|uniref:Uncharacterized protein n=1 Tax=Mycobacterium pinniadriaticum TaxID=2994102 RepID=A0ABT3SL86_9MYCO|nr:hypothetical protein [Mycobacterium pinniadriaticum]MCX2933437.1 hypothetical protein [Mycobacterium pinniadriaticum]MCX2939924.1 hypothetical protein [Mycobacterium pinniadriaticum]